MKRTIVFLLCVIAPFSLINAQKVKNAATYPIMSCEKNYETSTVSFLDTDGINGYDYSIIRLCDGTFREYSLDLETKGDIDPIPLEGGTSFTYYVAGEVPRYIFSWDKETDSPSNMNQYKMEEYGDMDFSISIYDGTCRVAATVFFPAAGDVAKVTTTREQSIVCNIIKYDHGKINVKLVDPMDSPKIFFYIQSKTEGKAWIQITSKDGKVIHESNIDVSIDTDSIGILRNLIPVGEYVFALKLNDVDMSETFILDR